MSMIIMGVGPVGGIIGGRLAKAGHNVTFVDVNPEHVQAIREHGLKVEVPDGTFNVNVPILFPKKITGKFDLAFIAVRAYNTKKVLSTLEPYLKPEATLVSLQNGMNPPILEDLVGPDRAIAVVVRMGCRLQGPGHVETQVAGQLYIGHLKGHSTPQLDSVYALLSSVMPTEIKNNILGLLWSKITYTCLGTFAALADISMKTILQDEPNQHMIVALLAEILEVGNSAGVLFEPLKEYNPTDFHPSQPYEKRCSAFAQIALNWKDDKISGIARSLKRSLKTEVDFTAGHVVREGERLGISTPMCRELIRFIHEVENGNRPQQMKNYKDLAAVTHH